MGQLSVHLLTTKIVIVFMRCANDLHKPRILSGVCILKRLKRDSTCALHYVCQAGPIAVPCKVVFFSEAILKSRWLLMA